MIQQRDLQWYLDLPFDYNDSAGFTSAESLGLNEPWSEPLWTFGHQKESHVASVSEQYCYVVIEGLQAFRWEDGSVRVFRLRDHWERLNQGAASPNLEMWSASWETFLDAVQKLIKGNLNWIPPYQACLQGASFYIRPNILGSSGQYRVKSPTQCRLVISGSPVGPYWKNGLKPNQLLWIDGDPRSMPWIKWSGNYAPTGAARREADTAECSAPLFSLQNKATETHAASFVALIDGVFCYRDDCRVLASITRDSLIQLCQDEGVEVQSTCLRQRDLLNASEMMTVGTAAGIQPIDGIKRVHLRLYGPRLVDLGTPRVLKGQAGPFAIKMSQRLWAIKTGQIPDDHNWMVQVG